MDAPSFLRRDKEGLKRNLETKFVFTTIKSRKVTLGNSQGKRLRRLFRPRKPSFDTEQAFRDDDIERRGGIEEIMFARVKAGLEPEGEDLKWREIANFNGKCEETENQHRGWIVAELKKRECVKPRQGLQGLDTRRKAERQLLNDTISLPNHGGIAQRRFGWLQKILSARQLSSKPKKVELTARRRDQAVQYIAACRRQAGIREDFEVMSTHRNTNFNDIKADLTVEEMEREIWPESTEEGAKDGGEFRSSDREDHSGSDGGFPLDFDPGVGQASTPTDPAGSCDGSLHTARDSSTTTLALRQKVVKSHRQTE